MDPMFIYLAAVLLAVSICVGGIATGRPPTRLCPQCGGRVSIMARTCRACRYRFER
jgi:hypothetical protein